MAKSMALEVSELVPYISRVIPRWAIDSGVLVRYPFGPIKQGYLRPMIMD
jgi:hypothetical protein